MITKPQKIWEFINLYILISSKNQNYLIFDLKIKYYKNQKISNK
jgi:hypothetical protein